jgi:hypothetical protein
MNNLFLKSLKILSIVLFCCFVFASCLFAKNKQNDTEKTDTIAVEKINKSSQFEIIETASIIEDSITLPSFEIKVVLSSNEREKIMESKEKLTVHFTVSFAEDDFVKSSFYRKQVAEDGLIYIISINKKIDYGEIAKFENLKISKKLYDDLIKREIWGYGYCTCTCADKFDSKFDSNYSFDFDMLKITSGEIFTIYVI